MNLDTQVWLIVAYLLPTVLAAWWLTGWSGRHQRLAIAVLLILPAFYMGHYLLLDRLQGWPSHNAVPASFRLLAHEAIEPNPRTGDPGRILIWLQADDEEQPRVHQTAYDAELHRQLSEAAERQSAGRSQRGEQRQAGTGAQGQQTGSANSNSRTLLFYDDIRSVLPPKTSVP